MLNLQTVTIKSRGREPERGEMGTSILSDPRQEDGNVALGGTGDLAR